MTHFKIEVDKNYFPDHFLKPRSEVIDMCFTFPLNISSLTICNLNFHKDMYLISAIPRLSLKKLVLDVPLSLTADFLETLATNHLINLRELKISNLNELILAMDEIERIYFYTKLSTFIESKPARLKVIIEHPLFSI